ncbi:extracellular solute-binding protein [Uliginosibacterium sp. 31-16]|uniref:extracellular solute-binding protein n=1 Tax=Uliginosibacterium sp. 31-16 TaxID=3068315 RepID=UPI00273D6C21|nr:extracellular solute-binding protein [Uliginosibacterium sp. 31-16]MDP5240367.1 extracellular solute-binding protein [Uliginosibacterium sp. 31-16]
MPRILLLATFALLMPLAQAGETLRILAWPGYVSQEAVRAFELRHAATVEVTVISSDDELWERARSDAGGGFDLLAVNTAELKRYIDADLVAPIRADRIPNTRKQLARFRKLANIPGISMDGSIYAIPYTYAGMGLIYNRKLVTPPPTSMNAMWDARYRGKVLAYNGGAHNFSLTALALGYRDPFHLNPEQFRRVLERLLQLRDNVLKFYSTPEEAVKLFQEHEVALIFANYGDQQIQELRRAGADIGYIVPHEGALAWLDCWAIMRRTPDRSLAEAWINHMLSPSVATQLTQEQGLANTLKDAPRTSMSENGKLVWLEPVENPVQRAAYWERILSGMPRPRPDQRP